MSNVLIIKYETSLKAKHKLPSHYFPKYTPGGATPTSYIMMAAPGARRKVRAQSTPPSLLRPGAINLLQHPLY